MLDVVHAVEKLLNFLRAAAFERRQAQAAPVVVQTLSSLPLDRQVGAEGDLAGP